MYILGFDIGGTKCAVITARVSDGDIKILKREAIPTDHSISAYAMLDLLMEKADGMLDGTPDRIGISCGGPLNSQSGIILSPPNLPGWDEIRICEYMEAHYGTPVKLQNDANACAVAEWKFGAGKGYKNLVFLTFGTGMGAGLILNGALYEGTNGNAGEVGHIRLCDDGPVGYGKAGSFEGFCSGGGIAKLAYNMALEKADPPLYFSSGMQECEVTAHTVAMAAKAGDETAKEVYRISAEKLGFALSVLIDILNPEAIIIGSIFARCEPLFRKDTEKIIANEALRHSASCVKILPAALGDSIGDYAALGVALL